jgi:hypothetical protein
MVSQTHSNKTNIRKHDKRKRQNSHFRPPTLGLGLTLEKAKFSPQTLVFGSLSSLVPRGCPRRRATSPKCVLGIQYNAEKTKLPSPSFSLLHVAGRCWPLSICLSLSH